MSAQTIKIGLVSISDRASKGVYEDLGLPHLQEWLAKTLTTSWQAETRLIPDDKSEIEFTLKQLVDDEGCSLILTTGGTGPADDATHGQWARESCDAFEESLRKFIGSDSAPDGGAA